MSSSARHLFLRVNAFGTLGLLVLATLYGGMHEYRAAAVNVGYAAFTAILYVFLVRRRAGFEAALNLQLALEPLVVTATTLLLGGFANSGYGFIWALLSPTAAVVFAAAKSVRVYFALFLVLLGTVLALQPANFTHAMPPSIWWTLSIVNLGGASTLIMLMLYQATAQLRAEQARSESLLLNVLPKDVAEILKFGPRAVADYFPGASVLFADVVGFTPLSAGMDPVELVGLLNEVFSEFDALVDRYGVEKIKTIGDCYMIAAGVPAPRADHAQVLVRLALEMRAAAAGRTFHGKRVDFRIGINSGPVVAGVIGRKKFIYDLWGDCVNVASRMESQGERGAIQITEQTYRLIAADFECEARGCVEVKGRGAMDVWHVIAPAAQTITV